MGYGRCKQRIKGIDKCKKRFCTILGIIKIIKRGGGVFVQGVRFDSKPSQDGEKDKKRKKREKKNVFGAGFEPTTLRLQILHLTR